MIQKHTIAAIVLFCLLDVSIANLEWFFTADAAEITSTGIARPTDYATIGRENNGTAVGHTDTLGTSTTFSIGSGVRNDDLVFLEVLSAKKSTTITPSIGFTMVNSTNADYFQLAVFDKVRQTGDDTVDIPLSWTGNDSVNWDTDAYVNADPASVVVSATNHGVSSNICTFPSVTPTTPTDMLLMICASNNGGSLSKFSEGSLNVQYASHDQFGIGDGDYLLRSLFPTDPQVASLSSDSSNTDWESVSISIKPSAGPAPVENPPSVTGGLQWYFNITPPNGGPMYSVGPYYNDAFCADTLGSVLYSHPFACHLGYTKYGCRITGNGFAYPSDFPFPVPASEQIPGSGCVEEKRSSASLPAGWYFLFYTATGGSVEKCSSLSHFRELAKTIPGDEIPDYRDMRCPGAPCFSVGFDTACN